MRTIGTEILRLLALTLRSRQIWWLAVAAAVLPATGAYLLARIYGAPPLPTAAVWFMVIPLSPLIWAMTGVRWAEADSSRGAGALRRAWGTPPIVIWASQFMTVAALGLAGGLLSTLVMVLVVPAWRVGATAFPQAMAAWMVLSFAYGLMLAWGWLVGAIVEGVWGPVMALGLPVVGLLASFVLGALSMQQNPSHGLIDAAIAASFFATGPWGYFVNKASDVWGFGPYAAAWLYTELTMLALILFGTLVTGWRQLGGGRGMRIWLCAAVCACLLGIIGTGAQVAAVSSPGQPASKVQGALSSGLMRQELLRLTLTDTSSILATAVLWPKAPGLGALWLNPRLTVTSVSAGGAPLAYRRTRGGWLHFRSVTAPLTISYRGDPLTVAETYQGYPAVQSFASPTGAWLWAGTFYPIPPGTVSSPLRPPVARFGLITRSPRGEAVLSNLGGLARGAVQWRRTTGIELFAGAFIPTKLPGFTLWSGPTGSSVWSSAVWIPRYPQPPHVLANLQSLIGRGTSSGAVVAIPWGAFSASIMPLGNPNPVLAPGAYPTPAEVPGVFGLFQGMGQSYESVAVNWLGYSDLMVQWASWTPAWYDNGSRFQTPYPAYQLPAATMLLTVMDWALIDGPVPDINWSDPAVRRIESLRKAKLRRTVLESFRELLRGGHWPTWPELAGLKTATKTPKP